MDMLKFSSILDDVHPSKKLRQFRNDRDDLHNPVDDVFCILHLLPNIPPEHGQVSLTDIVNCISKNVNYCLCCLLLVSYLSMSCISAEENMTMANNRLKTCWSARRGSLHWLSREMNCCFSLTSYGISLRIFDML